MKNGKPAIPTITTIKRSLGISRIHVVICIFFTIMLLTVWNPGFLNSTAAKNTNATANSTSAIVQTINSVHSSANGGVTGYSFIDTPLGVLPAIMLATPIILLFVYDKNNGMLEYFLSLGMRQREIYTSYLKAALLLVIVYYVILAPIYLGISYHNHTLASASSIFALMVLLGIADVAFMTIAMFAFSSLQKTRAGGNQPVGLIVGVAWLFPGFLIPFVLPVSAAVIFFLGEIILIAVVTAIMLATSDKLISTEKLLPS